MASTVGGDIIEVRYNHPTLGSDVFYPKSDEDSTYDLGGFRNNDDATSMSGDGGRIYQKHRTSPMFECVIANDMNLRKDIEKLAALAADPAEAEWYITNINGITYKLKGQPVGDMQPNMKTATVTLKVMGSGIMEQV